MHMHACIYSLVCVTLLSIRNALCPYHRFHGMQNSYKHAAAILALMSKCDQ